jgi:hypothetical protein
MSLFVLVVSGMALAGRLPMWQSRSTVLNMGRESDSLLQLGSSPHIEL